MTTDLAATIVIGTILTTIVICGTIYQCLESLLKYRNDKRVSDAQRKMHKVCQENAELEARLRAWAKANEPGPEHMAELYEKVKERVKQERDET